MTTPREKLLALDATQNLIADSRNKGVHLAGLVCLGGSHAYGLATENSDLDVRGYAFPTPSSVLLGRDFEQVQTQGDYDICIYSFKKIVKLLAENNPNIIELLGISDDAILYNHASFETMRNHPKWFLSRRIAHTFGGYATAQLRRLQNAMARDTDAQRLAEGALRSMQATLDALPSQYPHLADTATFALDLSNEEKPQVRVSMTATDTPATELASFARELDSARKSAETIGKNRRKESSKLAKHASHLIRLLHMGSEILKTGEVRTDRRGIDAEFLLEIKNGLWLEKDANGVHTYTQDFWDVLDASQKDFEYAEKNTDLPEHADTEILDDFLAGWHRRIIEKGD